MRLIGLACYGTQVVDLGADSITSATVTLVSNGAPAAWDAVIQGAAEGSRPAGAPTLAGDTVTVTVPAAAGASVVATLTAGMRADLADGTTRSLALVGDDEGGTFGTGRAPGWYLTLDYGITD